MPHSLADHDLTDWCRHVVPNDPAAVNDTCPILQAQIFFCNIMSAVRLWDQEAIMIRRDIFLGVEQVNVHVAEYVLGLKKNATWRPMKFYAVRYKKSTRVNATECDMAGCHNFPIHQQWLIIIYKNLWPYPFGIFRMFRSIGCKCICLRD